MISSVNPSPSRDLIFDSSVLIDICLIDEWDWIKENFGNLYIAELTLSTDNLNVEERECAAKHLQSIDLESDEEIEFFGSLLEYSSRLAVADRATITLAKTRELICTCDDNKMVQTCIRLQVDVLRTLDLLSEMNRADHKSKEQCIGIVGQLIGEKRNKHIKQEIIENWKQTLVKSDEK